MRILTEKRCIIGEGPIWNEREETLYFTNGGGKELCKYNFRADKLYAVSLEDDCAAFAFSKEGKLLASRKDGVVILNNDGSSTDIYDREKYEIKYANDMKAGPDGRLYVGTQSEKRLGISDKINGRLYSVDKLGNVRILLDGLRLSNGMEWSMDEKFFYHTDSDTGIIKEYEFDKEKGEIAFTNRLIELSGVDGFTIDKKNRMFAACWGKGYVAVVSLKNMRIEKYIELSCKIPSSCSFCGEKLDFLAVTTASFTADPNDKNAGFTAIFKTDTEGRKPYLFG